MSKPAKAASSDRPRKLFPGQHEGEVVELVFRQHPVVMRKALIFGLFGVLVAMVPLLIWSSTALVTNDALYDISVKVAFGGFAAVFLYWIYRWVGWFYSVYIVTNERIVEVKQDGFFNRRVSEFGLDKIQNVNYHIGGFQAVLFKYGDITAQTYVGDLVMSTIHHPVHIHEQIVDVVRRFGTDSTAQGE
jgi:uncharacterized membrane protein YdbT with pleckstrin-like domain